MPNVIVTPRSADYSEEVWLEIRAKTVEVLRSFVLDNLIPTEVTSDDDDDEDYYNSFTEEQQHQDKSFAKETFYEDTHLLHDDPGGNTSVHNLEFRQKQTMFEAHDSCTLDRNTELGSPEVRGSGKKARKRSGRRRAQQSQDDPVTPISVSGWDKRPTSQLPFASPDQVEAKLKSIGDEPTGRGQLAMGLALDQLKEGYVVALHALSGGGFYVARQTGPGRGWCLDIMSNVTTQDPAAQFLLIVRNRVSCFHVCLWSSSICSWLEVGNEHLPYKSHLTPITPYDVDHCFVSMRGQQFDFTQSMWCPFTML